MHFARNKVLAKMDKKHLICRNTLEVYNDLNGGSRVSVISFFDFRAGIRSLLILMPVMGITWIFGIFAVNKETVVFQYFFAIFNSIQVKLIQFASIYAFADETMKQNMQLLRT